MSNMRPIHELKQTRSKKELLQKRGSDGLADRKRSDKTDRNTKTSMFVGSILFSHSHQIKISAV